jgi:Mrp family chromosome partitioning ATPase
VTVVTDALAVGQQVEATLLVARWNSTPVTALRAAAEALSGAQVTALGVVMDDADPARLPEYAGGGSYAVGRRARYFDA